ncbi:MAG: hypothetical protein P4L66_02555, partial [Acetobacteraceae bacterium]|nr:hypothetical protein [Acetobacteraceae bacterium]
RSEPGSNSQVHLNQHPSGHQPKQTSQSCQIVLTNSKSCILANTKPALTKTSAKPAKELSTNVYTTTLPNFRQIK